MFRNVIVDIIIFHGQSFKLLLASFVSKEMFSWVFTSFAIVLVPKILVKSAYQSYAEKRSV